MGPRNFAMSCKAHDQSSEATRYGNDLNTWIRGWNIGLESTRIQIKTC